MKTKNLFKIESPIKNLNEKSFLNRRRILIMNKLPALHRDNSISFLKPKNSNSIDITSPLIIKKNNKNNNSSIDKNKSGIIWLKDEYFKVPKLILPKNINNINNNLSERKISLQKTKSRNDINNITFNLTKKEFPALSKLMNKKNINELFGLKKEYSHVNIYKKKEIDFDKLIKDMGILKYLDEKILKRVNVNKMDNNSKKNDRKNNKRANITILGKRIYDKYMKRKNLFIKNNPKNFVNQSYDSLRIKKKENIIKKNTPEKTRIFEIIRRRRIKRLRDRVNECDEMYKAISSKMKNLYAQKKNEFEQSIENEFSFKHK